MNKTIFSIIKINIVFVNDNIKIYLDYFIYVYSNNNSKYNLCFIRKDHNMVLVKTVLYIFHKHLHNHINLRLNIFHLL